MTEGRGVAAESAGRVLVLKLGGELLERHESRTRLAGLAASVARDRPLVVVHGGGRAVDAELERRGIVPRKVDGVRITDPPTLEAVIAVLAGSANTELVASLVAAGLRAVGLTGVDAAFGSARRTGAQRTTSGAEVDLGLVGDPAEIDATLIGLLLAHGYVPVVASLGVDERDRSTVLNVNADVMACRIAAALPGADLVIAGATAGVLGASGSAIARLDRAGIAAMVADGSATAGMIAKLTACGEALARGVASVRIIDGRSARSANELENAPGTTIYEKGGHSADERARV